MGGKYTAPADIRAHVTSVIDDRRESIYVDHEMTADEATLVSLGYKQEFKREFSLWTSFSVSFSVLGLLPSTASTLFVRTTIQLRLTGLVWTRLCRYRRNGTNLLIALLIERYGAGSSL